MANAKVIKLPETFELVPNQEGTYNWKLPTPYYAAWSVHAVPLSTDSSSENALIEVTRVWRQLLVSEKKPFPQSQTAESIVKHVIHFAIKNIGPAKASFDVFLSAIG